MIVKNVRALLLIVLILISLYLLLSPLLSKRNGVIVTLVGKESNCEELRVGDIITEVSGYLIKDKTDFDSAIQRIKAGERATMVVNGGPGGCTAIRDGDLGINVKNIESFELRFGIEIEGGEITHLKPERILSFQEIEKMKEIIKKRVDALSIPETEVFVENETIKIISLKGEDLSPIIMIGKFEAKLLEEVKLANGSGKIQVGGNDYTVKVENTGLRIDDSYYNQSFVLEGINFEIVNITNQSVTVNALILSNKDVKGVLRAYSYARYEPSLLSYQFYIPLQISNESSERFVKLTKRLGTKIVGGQVFLDASLVYFLDEEKIYELSIPFGWAGREIEVFPVVGLRKSMEAATSDMSRIQLSLETEKLPASLEIVKVEGFGPTYGSLLYVFEATFACVLTLSAFVTYYKYRKTKLCLYVFSLLASNLVLMLGAVALVQRYFAHGWIIDAQTLFGFFAILLINSALMFLSSEKIISKRAFELQYKYRKILSLSKLLIFLVVVLGLLSLFTSLRGFGLSLISGIAIGSLILVPMYQDALKKGTI